MELWTMNNGEVWSVTHTAFEYQVNRYQYSTPGPTTVGYFRSEAEILVYASEFLDTSVVSKVREGGD